MFAISSAIPSVQKLHGVRHAASGSAATNPAGTIKLHLNNVNGGGGGGRGEGGKKEKGERHREGKRERASRAASLQKKVGSENGATGARAGELRRGEGPRLREDVIALTTTDEKGGRFERSGLNK